MNARKLKEFFTAVGSVVLARGRSAPPIVADAAGVVAEGLESRLLFAVTASQNFTTNILTITGDANNNVIRVYQQDYATDTIGVNVQGQTPDLGPFNVNIDLTLVAVYGLGGADDIQFGSDTYGVIATPNGIKVSVPAHIHGGDGDDFNLAGTDNADTIWGDGGSDTLYGADGADIMYGGYGSSTNPDYSDDSLRGDGGADYMYGEEGNDTFDAVTNESNITDFLDGGDGSDTADITNGVDSTVSVETLI